MNLTDRMNAAAIAASEVILEVYATPFSVEEKTDGSPVTVADRRAEVIILDMLQSLGAPVLGEESVSAGIVPELGDYYFVVDPLDGTKEFLKRNGEFTVNIALCQDHHPRRGVVLAPATGAIYWGGPDGAFAGTVSGKEIIDVRRLQASTRRPIRVVASRSHGHQALGALCEHFDVVEDVSVGSSLKFCLLADGRAELYPRFTPTCEWDTAAGQAVLEAAGGAVLSIDGQRLSCGNSDRKFLNPFFVAAGDRELATAAATEMRRLLP